jgi:hypothetical protein
MHTSASCAPSRRGLAVRWAIWSSQKEGAPETGVSAGCAFSELNPVAREATVWGVLAKP